MNIRQALQAHQAYCVFSEPQFSPAVVDSVVNGTEVKVGDPLIRWRQVLWQARGDMFDFTTTRTKFYQVS